jgi:hypothetical protein
MNRVRGTKTIDFRPRVKGPQIRLWRSPSGLNPAKPGTKVVPTRAVLVHQTFIFSLNRPQAAEGRCGYAGSNRAFSVERDSVVGKNTCWNR